MNDWFCKKRHWLGNKKDCSSLIIADMHITTSAKCYQKKKTSPKQSVLFMPREQHSSQRGGDVSHAILKVHILRSLSLFPFVLIFYGCTNVKWGNELEWIPDLSARQKAFHTGLSCCIECSLACSLVLFPSLNKCTNPCKSWRPCQGAAQYSDLALREPSRA